jgi:hypothetical protein
MGKVKIELKSWSHECGDGCCHTYGVDIFINGKEVEGDGSEVSKTLEIVLKELNIEAEIIEDY